MVCNFKALLVCVSYEVDGIRLDSCFGFRGVLCKHLANALSDLRVELTTFAV